jgi:LemA protein
MIIFKNTTKKRKMDLDRRIESVKKNSGSSLKKYSKWILLAVIGLWAWSAYNSLVKSEVPAATLWANVETEYQSRADKVAVISKIVRNAANFEKQTLTDVIEARSKATSINLDMKDLTPENMAKFEKAQSQLTGALSRLMVTVERYPELKATNAFRDFQAQYEGIENRIAKARRDYNNGINEYNIKRKKFPKNIIANLFGFEEKSLFKANAGAENAPEDIDLGFDN